MRRLAALVGLVLLTLVACGSQAPALETFPDTVALPSIVMPTTPATEAAVTEAATTTTEMMIDMPAMATETAVRVSAPDPTTTEVETVPAPQWVRFDCQSFTYLLERYGLPTGFFLPVMKRESHCDPSAFFRGPRDWSFGLLQMNTLGAQWGGLQAMCGLSAREQLFDPETNISCAAQLYARYGRKPWLT